MSIAPGITAADAPAELRGLPRTLVLGWLAVFVGFLWLQGKSNAFTAIGALPSTVSVIEFIEVAVLVRLFDRQDTHRLSAAEALATLAGVAAVLLLVGRTATHNAWIAGASLIAFYVFCRFSRAPAQRAFTIALGLFVAQYLLSFGPFIWLHGLTGKVDAAVLRSLLDAVGYDVAGSGSVVVRQSSGFAVDVYYGCASTFALSLVLPGFLIVVLGIRGSFRAGDLLYMAALAGVTVCINVLRLMPTALSKEGHAFWHDGLGASLVSVAYAGLILAAAYAATRTPQSATPA